MRDRIGILRSLTPTLLVAALFPLCIDRTVPPMPADVSVDASDPASLFPVLDPVVSPEPNAISDRSRRVGVPPIQSPLDPHP